MAYYPNYYIPLDPNCSVARKVVTALFNNPTIDPHDTPIDDLIADIERSHRLRCRRCEQYGAANIEAISYLPEQCSPRLRGTLEGVGVFSGKFRE
jgi:hypothetical protein